MKNLLPILFVLIISSCSKEVPSDQLVERDGIYYEVNSQTGFTGTSISYYENGQLWEKITYTNGELDGVHERYYENGQLKYRINFKDDKYDGPYESHHNNGQLWYKTTYKNGKEEGLSESYSQNGELKFSGCYKNGDSIDMSYCD
jgi:antitoxin component YwqK of YwqJK toxin-antitoxin module